MTHSLIARAIAHIPTASLATVRLFETPDRRRNVRSDFTANISAVLSALLERCDIQSLLICKFLKEGVFRTITLEDIVSDTGLSRRTVCRLLRTLEVAGYIESGEQDRHMNGGYLVCSAVVRRLTEKLFEDMGLIKELREERKIKSASAARKRFALPDTYRPFISRRNRRINGSPVLFGTLFQTPAPTATPAAPMPSAPPTPTATPAKPTTYAEKRAAYEEALAKERAQRAALYGPQYDAPALCPA